MAGAGAGHHGGGNLERGDDFGPPLTSQAPVRRGRAPKRVTTLAATRTANSAAPTRSEAGPRAGYAPEPPRSAAGPETKRSAGLLASHLLMKAPQKASPAPVVSVACAGCAAIRTGASPGVASTQPAAPSFTTTTP